MEVAVPSFTLVASCTEYGVPISQTGFFATGAVALKFDDGAAFVFHELGLA